MPAVAVAGAAIAIGIAAEVGTTLAVIAAVGATIGAVGAVTGVKELQIAGTVIGAVGAIGGLASSAGLLGDVATLGSQGGSALADTAAATTAAETASPFMSAGDSIANEIANWSTYGATQGVLSGAPEIGSSLSANPVTDSGAFDVVDTVTGQAQAPDTGIINTANVNAAPPDVTPPVAEVQSGGQFTAQGGLNADLSTYGQTVDAAAPPGGSIINPAPTTPTAPPTPDVTVTATPPNPLDAGIPGSYNSSVNAALKVGSAPMDGGSVWKDIMGFVGKPGVSTLLGGVVQAGGAFISGATSQLTPAQIEALRAQAEANTAAANLARQQQQGLQIQQANANQPLPVAVRRPVTGQPAGLINSPPPSTPVTGQVTA